MTSPYVDQWEAYLKAGWSPFPLPKGRKAAPPTGWTGIGAPRPDYKTCWGWADDTANEAANIGVRMPDDVLGIDVDTYGNKRGDITLEAKITAWGPLPAAWRSSARDDPRSGVLVYRVPPGLQYPSQLGRDIELLRPGHRYAVVEPSVRHDDETVATPAPWGAVYRWTHPDVAEDLIGQVPIVADLPELPAAWVEGLTAGVLADSSRSFTRVAPLAELATWRRADAGQPCGATQRLAASLATGLAGNDVGGRHDALVNGMVALTKHGQEGHTGIPAACGVLAEAFRAAMTAPGSTRRYDPHEVDSATAWAVGALVGARARVDPCSTAGGVDAMVDAVQRRRGATLSGATAGAGPGSSTGPTGQAVTPPAPAVPVGDFPTDALPEAVRLVVEDLCRTGRDAPFSLYAPQALAVLSAALGGHVWAKAGSQAPQLVTLYVATFAPAAAGKSHGHMELLKPLRAAIADAVAAEEPDRVRRAIARKGAQARVDAAQRRYETIAKEWEGDSTRPLGQDQFDKDHIAASLPLERAEATLAALPEAVRWAPILGTDITPEELLVQASHQGVLALLDDEPGSMTTLVGGGSNKGVLSLEPLLSGYTGAPAGSWRKTVESPQVTSMRLTIGIMGQSGTREGLLRLMNVEGRGLLARWMWAQVPDFVGTDVERRKEADPGAFVPWSRLITSLVAASRANRDDVTITFGKEAGELVDEYDTLVAAECNRDDGRFGANDETRSWAIRSREMLTRIAVLFAACDDPAGFRGREVGLDHTLAALRVMDWARDQALAIFAPGERRIPTNPAAEDAWDALRTHEAVGGGSAFTARDVRDPLRRRLGSDRTHRATQREVAGFLASCVEQGRLVDEGRRVQGDGVGRPAIHYRLGDSR